MPSNLPSPERAKLDFADSVRSRFAFLEQNCGFKLESQDITFVRYESALVFVNAYHGRSSYELGLQVGPRFQGLDIEQEEHFSIWEIVRASGDMEVPNGLPAAQTREDIVSGLDTIADLLKRYGTKALAGDKEVFEQLRNQQVKETEEYLENAYREARKKKE